MEPTHKFRVFIDWEALEFLKSLRARERKPLEDFLRALIATGSLIDPDYTARDEVGRTIDYHRVGTFIARVWKDDADNHLKVLDFRKKD